MAQPLDIVQMALKDIGALAPGEQGESAALNDAFTTLNDMLDQWSNDPMMSYYTSEIVQNIGGLGTTFTIGSGGAGSTWINASRPVNIVSAFVRVSNLDYPVAILDVEEYELIGLKQLNGPWPRALYYQPTMPLGTINFWPNPSSGEIHLFCNTVFAPFATLSDTIQMPQGYRMAMRWNLAKLLMPSYGKMNQMQVQMVSENASQGIAYIKRTNMSPQQPARFDDVLTNRRGRDAGWILHGGFN